MSRAWTRSWEIFPVSSLRVVGGQRGGRPAISGRAVLSSGRTRTLVAMTVCIEQALHVAVDAAIAAAAATSYASGGGLCPDAAAAVTITAAAAAASAADRKAAAAMARLHRILLVGRDCSLR